MSQLAPLYLVTKYYGYSNIFRRLLMAKKISNFPLLYLELTTQPLLILDYTDWENNAKSLQTIYSAPQPQSFEGLDFLVRELAFYNE